MCGVDLISVENVYFRACLRRQRAQTQLAHLNWFVDDHDDLEVTRKAKMTNGFTVSNRTTANNSIESGALSI